ncbi:MAG TPA: hypothetical protein VGE02_12625 [Gemmatimonadales bacterium]
MKRTILALVVIAAGLWMAWDSTRRVGDLGVGDSDLARSYAGARFDAAAWRHAGPDMRGRMLADLAERHRLVGVHRDSIEALLGPNECYVAYEDEPCYSLELGEEPYDLQFGVNHSSRPGTVIGVRLVERPSRPTRR